MFLPCTVYVHKGLSDPFCQSIMQNNSEKDFVTFSKHIKQLKIICIRMYTYFAEADAVHGSYNSPLSFIIFRSVVPFIEHVHIFIIYFK